MDVSHICGCPTEWVMLYAAIALGLVHLLAGAAAGTAGPGGLQWAAGPRDVERPQGRLAGRLQRAFDNFRETFPFFAAGVLALMLMDQANAWSAWGAIVYVAARVVYLPLYAAGVPQVRTLVWGVSLVGLLLVLLATALT